MSDLSVAILAGGQSSRMGQNKAFVTIGGQPMIERVIDRVSPLSDERVIIANTPPDYAHLGLPVFTDKIPGKAALGGLYTAIASTDAFYTLVVSCDLPFLNPALLRYLADLRSGYDVIVPLNADDYPQSMHAIYSKNCLEPIQKRLEADRLKVIGFYDQVRVRQVGGTEIDRHDPDRHSFINVNTPEELEEARRLAAQQE